VYGNTGLTDTRLKLEKGGADSQVQPGKQVPGFRIDTPAVNLGVRGTEFRVRLTGDKSSSFEVLQGSVGGAGTVGAEVAVAAGFGATAVAGAPLGPPQALLPAPNLASLAPKLERVPLTPAWAPLPGAVAYRAQVYAEGAAEQLLLDGRFATPQAKWADLPDGRYQLRVRAVDAQGLEGRHADASFVLKARPEPPFSVKPAAAAKVYGTAVELGWTQAAAAARYHLQVSPTPDFAQTSADVADLKEPLVRLDLPHGSYHWRVASVTAAGDQGPWGDPQGFTLRPVPPSPPAEPPQVDGKALVFRWRVSEGASYQVQIARDAQFKDLVQDTTTREARIELTNPPSGSYHMRVRSIDPDGFAGAYGSTQSVEVPRPRWWLFLPMLLPLLLL
jgi:FecR protein